MPYGATTTGRGQNLIAWVMFWNARTARSTSSHSPSCMASSSCIRFAPTEKFALSPVMTKASKSATCWLAGFSVCAISETMSSPSAFILECSSIAATPFPRSITDAPAFFRTTPRAALIVARLDVPSGAGTVLYVPLAASK